LNQGKLSSSPSCPVCHRLLDGFTTPGPGARAPRSGDTSICCYCLSFLRFTETLQLCELTQDEIINLPANVRGQLVRGREMFRAWKQSPSKA
jgi:hypothetical protein